ncbi:MAG TPA: TIGR02757 family protein [Cryomorphaceae bacterium]|nr:TIGR02757 family protein [Cryomorphaceae bacterium]
MGVWAVRFEHPGFTPEDPISIPHRYTRREDIEAVGLMTAIIAWGRRSSIVQSANAMFADLGDSPVAFLVDSSEEDLLALTWAHRTFLPEDGWRFMRALQAWYRNHSTLEHAFAARRAESDFGPAIDRFRETFAGNWLHTRSAKHLASPAQGSAAKRLHLFLRWMVRSEARGVDFGLWTSLSPRLLSCPLDVHTGNVARDLGILSRKANDRRTVLELDTALRAMDSKDPVKYDFALFGLGESGWLQKSLGKGA